MRTRNLELIVGVFILAGLLALAVLAVVAVAVPLMKARRPKYWD